MSKLARDYIAALFARIPRFGTVCYRGAPDGDRFDLSPEGEWVRYEDVQRLVDHLEDIEADFEEQPAAALAVVRRESVALTPVMDVAAANARLAELQMFCASYLQQSKDGGQDGGDYGIIPGAGKKKVLFKSGAEKLCDVYGLADRYRVTKQVEDWATGLFAYDIECDLVRRADEMFVGSGWGSCSTYESKYRYRDAQRTCPECQGAFIIKGKAEYGGGFLCFKKKGGCGAKFEDGDPAITTQQVGRVENPDLADFKNTVLKMAKKRAKIDAVIAVTRSSGLFTQDLEPAETSLDAAIAADGLMHPRAANEVAKKQQKADAQRMAPGEPPATISKAQQDEIVAAVDRYSWRTDDVKRLLAAHGFAKSSQVTVDKLPAILDALKNGDVVNVPTVVGVVAPENAHVV